MGKCLGLWLLLFVAAPAKERVVGLDIPAPQGKFPPSWTYAIHVSLVDSEDAVADHRYWKPGTTSFQAVLRGQLQNQAYQVEVLCLSKGEKKMGVFRQPVFIDRSTKRLRLDRLRFVEWISQP